MRSEELDAISKAIEIMSSSSVQGHAEAHVPAFVKRGCALHKGGRVAARGGRALGEGAGHVGSVRSRSGWAFAIRPAMAPLDAHLRFSVGGCARSRRPQFGSHVPLLPLLLVRTVRSDAQVRRLLQSPDLERR